MVRHFTPRSSSSVTSEAEFKDLGCLCRHKPKEPVSALHWATLKTVIIPCESLAASLVRCLGHLKLICSLPPLLWTNPLEKLLVGHELKFLSHKVHSHLVCDSCLAHSQLIKSIKKVPSYEVPRLCQVLLKVLPRWLIIWPLVTLPKAFTPPH